MLMTSLKFWAYGAYGVAALLFILSALLAVEGFGYSTFFYAGIVCVFLGFVVQVLNSKVLAELFD